MDQLALLTYSEDLLDRVVRGLADDEMEVDSNCPPWTIRHLASHALKNQLFWAGSVVGEDLMPLEESMAAVPYEGDLGEISARRDRAGGGAVAPRRGHDCGTPHAVRRPARSGGRQLRHRRRCRPCLGRVGKPRPRDRVHPRDGPARLTDVFALTCNDHTVELGLIKPPTEPPADATDTERLLASAGRTIAR